MGLVRTVAPTVLAVSVEEARKYCRIPDDDHGEDATVEDLIAEAVDRCERVALRALLSQTWRLALDSFCDKSNFALWDAGLGWLLEIPRPPLLSVTSLQYVDDDGVTQTLATTEYQVDTNEEPGRIWPAYGTSWPTPRVQPNAVLVTYVAGYGTTAASVPREIRDRIKAHVHYCFEHRSEARDEEYLDNLFRSFWHGAH